MPIVEPDVSMAGSHTLEAAVAINTKIQSVLYRAMLEHGAQGLSEIESSVCRLNENLDTVCSSRACCIAQCSGNTRQHPGTGHTIIIEKESSE